MNRQSLKALVALNIVLLAALVVVSLVPQQSHAQLGGGAANYVMVAGEITGKPNQNCIYITELNSARMVAVMFLGGNNKLEIVAGRKLKSDVEAKGPDGVRKPR